MISYIVTIVAFVLTAIFALLVKVWAGFVYFVLATVMVLSLFWVGWLIYKYLTTFKAELEERFKFFKAEKVNSYEITSEYFDDNLAVYKKEFNKVVLKDKIIQILKIAFCFAVAIAFLLAIIFHK